MKCFITLLHSDGSLGNGVFDIMHMEVEQLYAMIIFVLFLS